MNKKLKWLVLPFLCFMGIGLNAQNMGKLLIVSEQAVEIRIDGESHGEIGAHNPMTFDVIEGEHYIQAVPKGSGKAPAGEIVQIEAGKQRVLNINSDALEESGASDTGPSRGETAAQTVAEVSMTVPGALGVGVWLSEHEGETYTGYPTYYYAFDKGDEITLDLLMSNKNGTNIIEVSTYPDGVMKYSNSNFQNLNDVRIKVEERSIYKIEVGTNAALDRSIRMKVGRIPGNGAAQNFNPNVRMVTRKDTVWKVLQEEVVHYETRTVQAKQKFYINSGSNAYFKGGTSRVIIPVKLPEGTVNWYYAYSAYREEADVNRVSGSLNLAADISKALDATGILGFGINLLTSPPGGDVCDLFLLDGQNISLFEAKEPCSWYREGSRENLTSGIIRMDTQQFQRGTWYIGVKNPSTYYGVHMVIEIVAVVAHREVQTVRKPVRVEEVKVPVMVE